MHLIGIISPYNCYIMAAMKEWHKKEVYENFK